MSIKKTLMTAVAVLTLAGTNAAMAVDRDHDGRPDRSWAEHHDHDEDRSQQCPARQLHRNDRLRRRLRNVQVAHHIRI